jgi:hypothetical protein
MKEAAVLLDLDGQPFYWHMPNDRSGGAIPDSRPLWDVIWENRARLRGIAHTHPGYGKLGPSREDITTFDAIERGLGRHLEWWISSGDSLVLCLREKEHQAPRYTVSLACVDLLSEVPLIPWVRELRIRSGFPTPS